MTGCPDGRRNKKEYRKGETQYDKKEPVIPDAGVRAAADAGSLREKSPSSSESGSRSETESTSVSGPQEELSEVVELTVGSERESAEEIPLDTKLKGKTVREETQWVLLYHR